MLSFPAAIKVYLCTVPCDMRRSFDGLSMMAEHVIRCNPFSGHLLVFCNRRTDRLKICERYVKCRCYGLGGTGIPRAAHRAI
jgi:transposase